MSKHATVSVEAHHSDQIIESQHQAYYSSNLPRIMNGAIGTFNKAFARAPHGPPTGHLAGLKGS